MPIGEPRSAIPGAAAARRRPARGHTYLLLLFGLALGSAALARLGTQWQVVAQRERETELLFRGLQIRDALQRFHAQTPTGQPALPQQLEQLLTDTRAPAPRHHLRRLYADPFTGLPDWVLMRDATGGIVGVHSRADRPALRRHGLPPGVFEGGAAVAVSQWRFAIAAAPAASQGAP